MISIHSNSSINYLIWFIVKYLLRFVFCFVLFFFAVRFFIMPYSILWYRISMLCFVSKAIHTLVIYFCSKPKCSQSTIKYMFELSVSFHMKYKKWMKLYLCDVKLNFRNATTNDSFWPLWFHKLNKQVISTGSYRLNAYLNKWKVKSLSHSILRWNCISEGKKKSAVLIAPNPNNNWSNR